MRTTAPGAGRIASVEISADGGAGWKRAKLEGAESPYDGTLWRATLDVQRAGNLELICCAVDAAGNTQPERRDSGRLDQYAYNLCHRIKCVVI